MTEWKREDYADGGVHFEGRNCSERIDVSADYDGDGIDVDIDVRGYGGCGHSIYISAEMLRAFGYVKEPQR